MVTSLFRRILTSVTFTLDIWLDEACIESSPWMLLYFYSMCLLYLLLKHIYYKVISFIIRNSFFVTHFCFSYCRFPSCKRLLIGSVLGVYLSHLVNLRRYFTIYEETLCLLVY